MRMRSSWRASRSRSTCAAASARRRCVALRSASAPASTSRCSASRAAASPRCSTSFAALDRPTAGRVRVAGTDLAHLGESALARWRGRHVGVVFQFFQLHAHAHHRREHRAARWSWCGRSPAQRAARARWSCWSAWASPTRRTSSPRCSRAGSSSARPSRGRSPTTRRCSSPTSPPATWTARRPRPFGTLFEQLAGQGKTLLIVTHDANLARGARRVVELRDGHVASDSARGRAAA